MYIHVHVHVVLNQYIKIPVKILLIKGLKLLSKIIKQCVTVYIALDTCSVLPTLVGNNHHSHELTTTQMS